MRVLMITQKLDPADPLLGFAVGWARALAARVDRLDVLCLEAARAADLPPNVRTWSMGKERGFGRLRMLAEFYRVLLRCIRHADVVFSHMVSRYVWLAAPLARLFGARQVLWYTHRQITGELRLALLAADRVATAVPDSFPLRSPKVHALGHGIDADFFTPDECLPPNDPPEIAHVARVMPIKHQATLIRALAAIRDMPAQAVFVGAQPDAAYLDGLQRLAADLGVSERVIFVGGVDQAGVRERYRRAAVAVNLSPAGLFDKAALESMMCGVPTLVSSPAFDPLLTEDAAELRIADPEDVTGLAERLRRLLALPTSARREIGRRLRERALPAHSLDGLMSRLVELMK